MTKATFSTAEFPQTLGSVSALRKAISQAFPDHNELSTLSFDGNYAQAWQVFARVLAISEAELARKLAPIVEVGFADKLDNPEANALLQIPFNFCQMNTVLPIRVENGIMMVATSNPFDPNIEERIRFLANSPIKWVLAAPEILADAVIAAYSKQAAREVQEISGKASGDDVIIKLARTLLNTAIEARASDLHIQPYLGASIVRIRVDGVLRRLTTLTDAVAGTVIRHYKASSGMDSTNAIIPQDGRMSLVVGESDYDMRVSTLPASRGERLVIRFLDQSRVHRLNTSGFSLAALNMIRRQTARPSGLVVMTGPTGSGKTSTLYGMLSEINRSSVNIITVENPVEYRIPGISQVDVNEKAGRSFAAALRSILRQDPDVLLIGEIRDHETADIALQAALTGRLVLTTLHTNDSITTIPRLLGLGVEASILSDALVAVISQRLCRMLCPACKVQVTEPLSLQEKCFHEITRHYPGHRSVGCEQCDYTGFRGRLPIVDIVEVGDKLRDAIATGETRISALQSAREGGLKSLAASGGLRIVSGDTTINEVIKSVGHGFWHELANYYGTQLQEDELNLITQVVADHPGVVLISKDATLSQEIDQSLKAADYKVITVPDPVTANQIFKQEENITFVVMDIENDTSLSAAVERLREASRIMYWSRLPALVLLPPGLAEQESVLRENGVISPSLAKPVKIDSLLAQIRRSYAR